MSVRLIFRGHSRVRVVRVQPGRLATACRDTHQDTGCFQHHGEWRDLRGGQVIRVTFRPTIYLNRNISRAAAQDARAHEQRHYDGFERIATNLRDKLSAAAEAGTLNASIMQSYWNWFLYDICTASAAFHRSTGGMVEICHRPGGSRPP